MKQAWAAALGLFFFFQLNLPTADGFPRGEEFQEAPFLDNIEDELRKYSEGQS